MQTLFNQHVPLRKGSRAWLTGTAIAAFVLVAATHTRLPWLADVQYTLVIVSFVILVRDMRRDDYTDSVDQMSWVFLARRDD